MDAFSADWHEHDRYGLLAAVAHAWYLIFPPDCCPRPLDFDRLASAIEQALEQLDELRLTAVHRRSNDFLDAVSQPSIFSCASLLIVGDVEKKKKLSFERLQARMESLAILRAVVNVGGCRSAVIRCFPNGFSVGRTGARCSRSVSLRWPRRRFCSAHF